MKLSKFFRTFAKSIVLIILLLQTSFCQGISTQGSLTKQSTPPSPVYFENDKDALDIPFRVIDNNMFITIVVNDSVELDVAFDSGLPFNGVILLDPGLGKKLNLQYMSETPLGGAGDNLVTAKVAMGGTVSISGARFTNQQLFVVSQSDAFSDWPTDGVIGGTLFNACVVEVDHDKQIINLYNPALFDAEDSGEEIDLMFSMGIPVVDATLTLDNGTKVTSKLLFDTGADVPLSLHGNFAKVSEGQKLSQECYVSDGISGRVYGKWGRFPGLKIGNYEISDVLVVYPTRGFEDVVTMLGQDGFFGFVLQSRFNITFNYTESKLYLKPSKQFSAPFEFNMAGLILNTQADGFRKVMDVIQGSTGDIAGIKKNDIIIEVNDQEVRDISDFELEKLLIRDGQELELTLERDSEPFKCSLILKRLF